MDCKKYEMPVVSERNMRRIRQGIIVLIVIYIFLDLVGLAERSLWFFACAAALYVLLACLGSRLMERCVWSFEEEGIRRSILGFESYIYYDEVVQALQKRKMKVTADAYQVPKGRGYITFPYEVGNAEMQKMTKECYKFLLKKIHVDLPHLTNRVIPSMDRSFFYKKDQRKCCMLILLSGLLMIMVGGDSVVIGFGAVILCVVVQYAMLEHAFKDIYFGKKVEKKIQGIFVPYLNVEVRNVKISYAQLVFAAILAVVGNLCFIYIGWRLL